MKQRVTLALIYQELGYIKESQLETKNEVREIAETLQGTPASPGLVTQIDRLNQLQASRRRAFGYVWTAICGIALAIVGYILPKLGGITPQ